MKSPFCKYASYTAVPMCSRFFRSMQHNLELQKDLNQPPGAFISPSCGNLEHYVHPSLFSESPAFLPRQHYKTKRPHLTNNCNQNSLGQFRARCTGQLKTIFLDKYPKNGFISSSSISCKGFHCVLSGQCIAFNKNDE